MRKGAAHALSKVWANAGELQAELTKILQRLLDDSATMVP